jgi:hypothetical protein
MRTMCKERGRKGTQKEKEMYAAAVYAYNNMSYAPPTSLQISSLP